MDEWAHHGVLYQKSAGSGSLSRYAGPEVSRRALESAGVPPNLAPGGVSRKDGRPPDGITLMAWKDGLEIKLVYIVTCAGTVASTPIN